MFKPTKARLTIVGKIDLDPKHYPVHFTQEDAIREEIFNTKVLLEEALHQEVVDELEEIRGELLPDDEE